jgi:prepilin signal peptidase PulO-like enzyme (type II secretory pathway)
VLSWHWKKSEAVEAAGWLLYIILAAVLLLLHYSRFNGLFSFIEQGTLSLFMVYFMGVDLRQWRVPVTPSLLAFFLGLSFSSFQISASFTERVLGALGGVLFLWSVLVLTTYFSRRQGVLKDDEFSVGTGDFLIVAVIGAFIGYTKMPQVIALGSLQAIILFVLGKFSSAFALLSPWPDSKASYPLAAFLCLAVIEILIVGY